jgi:hypothetical protein
MQYYYQNKTTMMNHDYIRMTGYWKLSVTFPKVMKGKFGKKHHSALEAINVDFNLVDKARQMSFDLGDLLARVHTSRKDWMESQLLRNKAFYHLKEAVDVVRKAGKYAFGTDKDRYKGYISSFLQRKYQKSKLKTGKTVK